MAVAKKLLQVFVAYEDVRFSKFTVHQNLLYIYHVQRLQALMPTNYKKMIQFCPEMLRPSNFRSNFKRT